ncbi:hypothetical protein DIPPA_22892 [Diplonema papillatum]|nr:hypothetical protein DIPPA_22892 [Diplonema papillatum]
MAGDRARRRRRANGHPAPVERVRRDRRRRPRAARRGGPAARGRRPRGPPRGGLGIPPADRKREGPENSVAEAPGLGCAELPPAPAAGARRPDFARILRCRPTSRMCANTTLRMIRMPKSTQNLANVKHNKQVKKRVGRPPGIVGNAKKKVQARAARSTSMRDGALGHTWLVTAPGGVVVRTDTQPQWSEYVATVAEGRELHVVEVLRREGAARVDHPVEGWISLRDPRTGDRLIRPARILRCRPTSRMSKKELDDPLGSSETQKKVQARAARSTSMRDGALGHTWLVTAPGGVVVRTDTQPQWSEYVATVAEGRELHVAEVLRREGAARVDHPVEGWARAARSTSMRDGALGHTWLVTAPGGVVVRTDTQPQWSEYVATVAEGRELHVAEVLRREGAARVDHPVEGWVKKRVGRPPGIVGNTKKKVQARAARSTSMRDGALGHTWLVTAPDGVVVRTDTQPQWSEYVATVAEGRELHVAEVLRREGAARVDHPVEGWVKKRVGRPPGIVGNTKKKVQARAARSTSMRDGALGHTWLVTAPGGVVVRTDTQPQWSEYAATVAEGRELHVAEVLRREGAARVDHPVEGWVSLRDPRTGDRLIRPARILRCRPTSRMCANTTLRMIRMPKSTQNLANVKHNKQVKKRVGRPPGIVGNTKKKVQARAARSTSMRDGALGHTWLVTAPGGVVVRTDTQPQWSEYVATVAEGRELHVAEVLRREGAARVDHPVEGWVSLRDPRTGDRLIRPAPGSGRPTPTRPRSATRRGGSPAKLPTSLRVGSAKGPKTASPKHRGWVVLSPASATAGAGPRRELFGGGGAAASRSESIESCSIGSARSAKRTAPTRSCSGKARLMAALSPARARRHPHAGTDESGRTPTGSVTASDGAGLTQRRRRLSESSDGASAGRSARGVAVYAKRDIVLGGRRVVAKRQRGVLQPRAAPADGKLTVQFGDRLFRLRPDAVVLSAAAAAAAAQPPPNTAGGVLEIGRAKTMHSHRRHNHRTPPSSPHASEAPSSRARPAVSGEENERNRQTVGPTDAAAKKNAPDFSDTAKPAPRTTAPFSGRRARRSPPPPASPPGSNTGRRPAGAEAGHPVFARRDVFVRGRLRAAAGAAGTLLPAPAGDDAWGPPASEEDGTGSPARDLVPVAFGGRVCRVHRRSVAFAPPSVSSGQSAGTAASSPGGRVVAAGSGSPLSSARSQRGGVVSPAPAGGTFGRPSPAAGSPRELFPRRAPPPELHPAKSGQLVPPAAASPPPREPPWIGSIFEDPSRRGASPAVEAGLRPVWAARDVLVNRRIVVARGTRGVLTGDPAPRPRVLVVVFNGMRIGVKHASVSFEPLAGVEEQAPVLFLDSDDEPHTGEPFSRCLISPAAPLFEEGVSRSLQDHAALSEVPPDSRPAGPLAALPVNTLHLNRSPPRKGAARRSPSPKMAGEAPRSPLPDKDAPQADESLGDYLATHPGISRAVASLSAKHLNGVIDGKSYQECLESVLGSRYLAIASRAGSVTDNNTNNSRGQRPRAGGASGAYFRASAPHSEPFARGAERLLPGIAGFSLPSDGADDVLENTDDGIVVLRSGPRSVPPPRFRPRFTPPLIYS